MTRKELPAKAANLQRAIASTTSCTSATVESLRCLLLPTDPPALPSKRTVTKTLPPKRIAATGPKATKEKTKNQHAINILEVPVEEVDQIGPQQKIAFATQIVNVTLKELSAAIKNPPRERKRTPLKRTSSNISSSNNSESRNHKPLQSLDSNRLANTPNGKAHSRRSSSIHTADERFIGLQSQAQCGRIAFATLRLMEGQNVSPKIPFLQLESGMSALIGRLITLGFEDLAVKELRILRKRLEACPCSSSEQKVKKSTSSSVKTGSAESKAETLADLLSFNNIDAQGQLLSLIIATQSQVLKILSIKKEPHTTKAAIKHLRLDVTHCPAIMIQRQVESGSPISTDKAAQQLETLAQSLMALCPSPSTVEDLDPNKFSKCLLPDTEFELQSLAMQIRMLWWNLSGRQVALKTELFEPFNRCLKAFHRRSKSDKKTKYETAKTMFDIITDFAKNRENFQEKDLLSVYNVLTDLAQDCAQFSDAITWIEKSRNFAGNSGISQARLCSLNCRLASLRVRVQETIPSEILFETLNTAATSLSGNLQGESAELDDLLVNVASLRRSALFIFQDAHKTSNPNSIQNSPALIKKCSEIVLLCLRFVLRYVGSCSSQCVNRKTAERQDQRRQLAAQFANPIIASVATIARLSVKASQDNWTKLDMGLRDCFALAMAVESVDTNDPHAQSEDKHGSPFVTISNAYWFRYLHLKQVTGQYNSSKDCLRRSIDAMKTRPPREQIAGSLALKLEKHAQICELLQEYQQATEIYQEALQIQIDHGMLETAKEAAKVRSLPDALDCEENSGVLSRVLLVYTKTAAKAGVDDYRVEPFLDLVELSAEERGVILEQQLTGLLSMYQKYSFPSRDSQTLNKLAKALLSVYKEATFPVRRLRVIVRLLGLLSSASDVLDDELQGLLRTTEKVAEETHSDMGLLQFLPHLLACREVLINLCRRDFDIKKLEAVMATWSRLLNENPSWDRLENHIHDMSDWLSLLEIVAEYLGALGLELTRLSVLHILISIHEISVSTQCSTLVSKLSSLGLQYARLGYSGHASVVFCKAQKFLETSDVPVEIALRLQLDYAEHCLWMGNLKRCGDALDEAQKLFCKRMSDGEVSKMRSQEQTKLSLLITDAYHVHSLLAEAEGRSISALYFARLSVKSNQRSWAILEKSNGKKFKAENKNQDTSTDENLAGQFSEMSIGEDRVADMNQSVPFARNFAAFWSLVPRLFHGFVRLSQIFAFHGLFSEVKYYLEQAQKIADSVKAPAFIGQYSSLMGECLRAGSDWHKGLENLQTAEDTLSAIPHDRNYVQLHVSFARHHTEHGDWPTAQSAFAKAEQTLQSLMTKDFLGGLIHQPPQSEGFELQLGALRIQETKTTRHPSSKNKQATSTKKATSKQVINQVPAKGLPEEIAAVEAVVLNQIRRGILRRRILAILCHGSLVSAAALLEGEAFLSSDQYDLVQQALVTSQIQLRQGIKRLISNPVYCVLQESTISCPSIRAIARQHQAQQKSPAGCQDTLRANVGRPTKGKGSVMRTRRRSPARNESEMDLLVLAQTGLDQIHKLAKTHASTNTLHEIAAVLGKILMMLSATPLGPSSQPASPTFIAYILEVGRWLSMTRESTTLRVEQRLSQDQSRYEWPKKDAWANQESFQLDPFEFANFQTDCINSIPSTWTVASITLSESREELLICKMVAKQTPLVLRLPLSRPNSLEDEDEIFGFDEGKAELQEIIRLTNESTHGAQDLSQKGAKTRWWEARTALDARLGDLLTNIESVWLGGFKGIFSNEMQNQDLLARLHQSLQNILDKHLPSRQRCGKGNQREPLNFDYRVVELFVGLGCPSEAHDIDEPLKDLLYFVVDILQFNGERNAYDEVDFDSIAVETTDALRQYHQALCDEAPKKTERHIILVLDRHLHCFPWESLPCLKGQAVSRLPSLGCLKDRIIVQRERQKHQDSLSLDLDRFFVGRDVGASILNPGGDLKATESKFLYPLQDLAGWETLVQKEPTESEMKNLLENNEVVLYFGHGSGSQYIRSRVIKRLEKCAVALLMGCSSGALTEAGEFESYGTPINYMHAGSPAVVATLWDVTDKDIDKFSQTVLEEWGLFGKSTPPPPAPTKSPTKKNTTRKGKNTIEMVPGNVDRGKDGVSLDEAVSRGRDSCILKYLNGAAPVVYGIPVFLS